MAFAVAVVAAAVEWPASGISAGSEHAEVPDERPTRMTRCSTAAHSGRRREADTHSMVQLERGSCGGRKTSMSVDFSSCMRAGAVGRGSTYACGSTIAGPPLPN